MNGGDAVDGAAQMTRNGGGSMASLNHGAWRHQPGDRRREAASMAYAVQPHDAKAGAASRQHQCYRHLHGVSYQHHRRGGIAASCGAYRQLA